MKSHPSFKYLVLLGIAALMLLASCGRPPTTSIAPTESTLHRINREGVLRVGYGVWAPFSQENVSETEPSKRVSGFSIDLVQEIANRAEPKLKVEFVRFNWATVKADIESGRFDVIAEPLFLTVPRAQIFAFSRPYARFGVACAIVRADDNRFKSFADLDRDDITVALAEGWTSTDYAKANLTKPKFKMVLLRENNFAQLEDVLFGRADVALQDAPTVLQFAQAHQGKVKALWLDTPPSMVAGAFAVRPGDADLVAFLNASLEILEADGTLARLDRKWKTQGFYEERRFRAGTGLANP